MRGHAHDSGADGYDFGVSAILTAPNARAVAFAHTGHVGGTFTSGSRDHHWDETYPAQALVRAQFPALAHGQFQLTTQYSSDLGSTVESVVSGIVPFLLGATPVGAMVGVVVFVGAEVGSLISTGSLVPGARLAGRVLWLAGPSNTLLALAAEGIASAGSRTRELTEEEYRWANDAVFSGSLPPRTDLVLTDTIGGGNRAFTNGRRSRMNASSAVALSAPWAQSPVSYMAAAVIMMATVPSAPRRSLLPHTVSRPDSPYLRPRAFRTRSVSARFPIRAFASTVSPVGMPRNVHGATVTRLLRRIRLSLPLPTGVQTARPSSWGTAQSGVGTARPSLRNVVSSTYFAAPRSVRVLMPRSVLYR